MSLIQHFDDMSSFLDDVHTLDKLKQVLTLIFLNKHLNMRELPLFAEGGYR